MAATPIPPEKAEIFAQLCQLQDGLKMLANWAQGLRHRVEEMLVEQAGFTKTEGQETFVATLPDRAVTLTCKQPVYVNVDAEMWEEALEELPADHPSRKAVRIKYELARKEFGAMSEEDAAPLTKTLSSKPGKVSLEVK